MKTFPKGFKGYVHLPDASTHYGVINMALKSGFYFCVPAESIITYSGAGCLMICQDGSMLLIPKGFTSYKIEYDQYYVNSLHYASGKLDELNLGLFVKGLNKTVLRLEPESEPDEFSDLDNPHLFSMIDFAKNPKGEWQFSSMERNEDWKDCEGHPLWVYGVNYRRKPAPREFPVTTTSEESLKDKWLSTTGKPFTELANYVIQQHILNEERNQANVST